MKSMLMIRSEPHHAPTDSNNIAGLNKFDLTRRFAVYEFCVGSKITNSSVLGHVKNK